MQRQGSNLEQLRYGTMVVEYVIVAVLVAFVMLGPEARRQRTVGNKAL